MNEPEEFSSPSKKEIGLWITPSKYCWRYVLDTLIGSSLLTYEIRNSHAYSAIDKSHGPERTFWGDFGTEARIFSKDGDGCQAGTR